MTSTEKNSAVNQLTGPGWYNIILRDRVLLIVLYTCNKYHMVHQSVTPARTCSHERLLVGAIFAGIATHQ